MSNGEVIESARAAERLSECDLHTLLREQEVVDRREVKELYLEPGGKPGLLVHEWARETQKKDLQRVLEAKE